MRSAAWPAEEPLNPDDLGGLVGRFTGIVAVAMTFGVVAERAGDYLLPRMCGSCF